MSNIASDGEACAKNPICTKGAAVVLTQDGPLLADVPCKAFLRPRRQKFGEWTIVARDASRVQSNQHCLPFLWLLAPSPSPLS